MYIYGISGGESTFEMNTDLDDVKILRRELYLDFIFIWFFFFEFFTHLTVIRFQHVFDLIQSSDYKYFIQTFTGLACPRQPEARAVIWTLTRGVGDTRNSCCKSYMLGSKWYLEQLLWIWRLQLKILVCLLWILQVYIWYWGVFFWSLLLNVCSVIYSCRCTFIDTIMNLQLYFVYYGYFQIS